MEHFRLKPWLPLQDLLDSRKMYFMAANPSPGAIELIKKLNYFRSSSTWDYLCANEYAIDLVLENLDTIKINWEKLQQNTSSRAIALLRQNPEKLNTYFRYLSGNINPEAIALLRENFNLIDWNLLSANPSAIDLIVENITLLVNWMDLSANPSPAAIELLRENLNRINWKKLSTNTSPGAIKILRENPERIDWQFLSANPSAIKLLRENPQHIDWKLLSMNPSPLAIEMLHNNPEHINWQFLVQNKSPRAMDLIKQQYLLDKTKINIVYLMKNPNIFDNVDNSAIKIQKAYRDKQLRIKQEQMRLAKKASRAIKYAPPGQFHPSFPGGQKYLEANERWERYHSFGKRKVRLSLKQLKRDLKKVS